MARKPTKEQLDRQSYETLMQRLEDVVGRLEGGGLSLEDSLAAFEEGVALVRAGECRLSEAEKKVEMLLSTPDGDQVVSMDGEVVGGVPDGPDAGGDGGAGALEGGMDNG